MPFFLATILNRYILIHVQLTLEPLTQWLRVSNSCAVKILLKLQLTLGVYGFLTVELTLEKCRFEMQSLVEGALHISDLCCSSL